MSLYPPVTRCLLTVRGLKQLRVTFSRSLEKRECRQLFYAWPSRDVLRSYHHFQYLIDIDLGSASAVDFLLTGSLFIVLDKTKSQRRCAICLALFLEWTTKIPLMSSGESWIDSTVINVVNTGLCTPYLLPRRVNDISLSLQDCLYCELLCPLTRQQRR